VPLAQQSQQSFAAGMYRSTESPLIPPDGAWDITNYFLDLTGVASRRGGILEATGAFGTDGLTFVGDYRLQGGQRLVVAHGSGFGVLGPDGTTIIDLGGAGLDRPVPAHAVGGELIFDGGVTYAGSQKAAYSTGTIAVTNGSKVVTGTGTDWTTGADNGMFLTPDGRRSYRVQSIEGLTKLTLAENYVGPTASASAYTLAPFSQAPRIAPMYCVVTKRLLWLDHDQVGFSDYDDPRTFNPNNVHRIPGGAEILGGTDRSDAGLIFTTDGVWQISNMDLDVIDDFGNVQQRVDRIDPIVLWRREGIAKWNGQIIVPAVDGIWMLGMGRIDLPITQLYQEYVHSGYHCGLAIVHRGHYLLPILGSDNRQVDLLVSRLDPPVWRGRHVPYVYPWTHFNGDGASARAFTQQLVEGEAPRLLVASGASPKVLEARYFDPNSAVADDLGTTFQDQIETRDYPTGNGNQNVSRFMALDYEMVDTVANVNPTISAAFAIDTRNDEVADWGMFDWGGADWSDPDSAEWYPLVGTAPEEMERNRKKWAIADENGAPRSRHIAFRLRSSGRVAKLIVRGITLWTRQSTKAD
jgi:hypothetical protein